MKNDLVILHTYPPLKMEQTECSETSAYKIQTPVNYSEENIEQDIESSCTKYHGDTYIIWAVKASQISLKNCLHYLGKK
jgi:hypothetical protein